MRHFSTYSIIALISLTACSPESSSGLSHHGAGGQGEAPDLQGTRLPPGCSAELEAGVATQFYDAIKCIFLGPGALQTGVEADTINPERAAVLRGRVTDNQGNPLDGVGVQVLSHPEFGKTTTRADGYYDLVVNGGGQLTVRVSHKSYLASQRHLPTRWRRFENYPDVRLVPPGEAAPPLQLKSLVQSTLVVASQTSDEDGERRHSVVVSPEQKVKAVLATGEEKELDSMTLRATEFTVGANGPQAMPGNLPSTSAYTYALDLSLVEAEELGGAEVEFDPPLVHYVDNFLAFPAGTVVPVGAFDTERDVWEASESGLVIEVTSSENGKAGLDMNGDGEPDDEDALLALGIDEDELALIASQYRMGDSFWRVETPHFSSWDCNWPYGFPADAVAPVAQVATSGPKDCKRTVQGSIIGCEDQTLGEELALVGTPYRLRYQSERMPGRSDLSTLNLQISSDELPDSLKRIEVEMHALGDVIQESFEPESMLKYEWSFNGQDAYGRSWQGAQPVEVKIGYVYDGAYESTSRFGQVGSGTPITGDASRQEITSWTSWQGSVGGLNYDAWGLGGWSLDVHHVFDREAGVLHLGSGRTRSAKDMGAVLTRVAGSGDKGFVGDDGPALEAELSMPHGIVAAPDGTIFFSDEGNHRIRRIRPDGTIDTYAGSGESGAEGDGGPASAAQLGEPLGLALSSDGTLYVCQRSAKVVRAIAPDGTIRTFAGGGDPVDGLGDGLLATEGSFEEPHAVAVAADGSVYIADANDNRIRRVDTSERLSTIAGNGQAGSDGDGGPAVDAELNSPLGIAIDEAGTLYVTEYHGARVRRIDASGLISTLVGNGTTGFSGDGGPANLALIDSPHDVQVGIDGSIFFSDEGNSRIRRVKLDGNVETVAGNGKSSRDTKVDTNPLDAGFGTPRVMFAAADGALWIGDHGDNKILRIDPALPGFSLEESMIASGDGSQLFVFDRQGRHLRTIDAFTGFIQLSFGYDDKGRLTSLSDGFGKVTQIERDGEKPIALIAPYGQRTEFSLNTHGYLSSVSDPSGATTKFEYSTLGLLTSFEEAGGDMHHFEYDERGLLLRDESPSGYFQSFERASVDGGYSVTRTHRDVRPELHKVVASKGTETRTYTDAAGISTITERINSQTVTTTPQTSESKQLAADPRFGVQAPYPRENRYTAGPGLDLLVTKERTVKLAEPSNPLSLESWNEVTEVGDLKWTESWKSEDRSSTVTSPEGRTITVVKNEAGQVESKQVAQLAAEERQYDNAGRLQRVLQGEREYKFEYGSDGWVSAIIDPLGQRMEYERDTVGLVTRQSFADGTSLSMAHNTRHQLASLVPPGQNAHEFEYASGGLLASYSPPQSSSTSGNSNAPMSFNYDPFEALQTVDDGSGEQLEYSYEVDTGRLQSITLDEEKAAFSYDDKTGQLSAIQTPAVKLSLSYQGALPAAQEWSGQVQGRIALEFDEQFRTSSETVGELSLAFNYDDDGLLTKAGALSLERDAGTGAVLATGLDEVDDTWQWNDYGELAGYEAKHRSDILYSRADERDGLGRVVRRTEVLGDSTRKLSFSYDLRGQLTAVEQDGEPIENYDYDKNGNRVQSTVHGKSYKAEYDGQDRIITLGDASFSQTAAGDLVRKSQGSQQTDYHYDRRGALRKAQLSDGRTIEYVLDGLGRRVGKKVDGSLVQGLLYRDPLNPVAELEADGTTIRARFVYGTSFHVPDYMIKGGETYRFIVDQVGSVRLVVNVSDGTIAQHLDYSAFGEVLSDTNPGFQPFGFAGGLYDPDTGLVRFGARDYDPVSGRWTAKDPILFGGGQANLYVYVGNDPVNFVDPEGEFAALGALAIGVGLGVAGEIASQMIFDGRSFSQLDGTNIAIAAGFGALGGGLGFGIGSLAASAGYKWGLGALVAGELGLLETIAQEAVNSAQRQNANGTTGLELLTGTGAGAGGEIVGPAFKALKNACH